MHLIPPRNCRRAPSRWCLRQGASILLAFGTALGIATATAAFPEILDADDPGPHDATRALLVAAAPHLHANTVDVVLGPATSRAINEEDTVRLARLDAFVPTKLSWAQAPRAQWTYGFEKGLVEAVLAVQPNLTEVDRVREACASAKIPTEELACKFTEEWVAAPAEKRVFVAFTRDDRDAAQAVRGALEALGYIAFVYLRNEGDEPWASSKYVGAAYSQAGIRLVIDSPASRGSQGVAFEACAWALAPNINADDRWTRRIDE